MANTKNYAIVMYDEGDLAQLLSIYNVAMEQIDAILFRLNAGVELNAKEILILQRRMDAVETRLTIIEDRLADIDVHLTQIDNHLTEIDNRLTIIEDKGDDMLKYITAIVNKVYGGGTVQGGAILWGSDTSAKIAVGNMTLFGDNNYIRARADGENDVRMV